MERGPNYKLGFKLRVAGFKPGTLNQATNTPSNIFNFRLIDDGINNYTVSKFKVINCNLLLTYSENGK